MSKPITSTRCVRALAHVATVAGCILPWAHGSLLSAQGGTAAFDRTKPPAVPVTKPPTLPKPDTVAQLQNGITVAILVDHHVPLVSVRTVMYIPPALEPDDKMGLTKVVREMLKEGTTSHTPEQLADAFATLGDTVSPFGFYTTSANLDQAIDLMGEQLMHPAFPAPVLERIKTNMIERLHQGQEDAEYLARRLFANIIYGRGHSYAREENVYPEEVSSITRDDVVNYYKQYFCPPNVMFVVAGDVTPAEVVKKLDRVFGSWASGQKAAPAIQLPTGSPVATVYLFDRPHSPESVIALGDVGLKWGGDAYPALLVNTVLGGTLSSRLATSLRDQHHYTDSIGSHYVLRQHPQGSGGLPQAKQQAQQQAPPAGQPNLHLAQAPAVGPQVATFLITTRVPAEKTDSAVNQVLTVMRELRSTDSTDSTAITSITPEEISFAKSAMVMHTTLQFETLEQRAQEVATQLREEIPFTYYQNYQTVVNRFRNVGQDKILYALNKYVDPYAIGIVVVGDRSVLEPKFRAADIAPVVILERTGGIGAN